MIYVFWEPSSAPVAAVQLINVKAGPICAYTSLAGATRGDEGHKKPYSITHYGEIQPRNGPKSALYASSLRNRCRRPKSTNILYADFTGWALPEVQHSTEWKAQDPRVLSWSFDVYGVQEVKVPNGRERRVVLECNAFAQGEETACFWGFLSLRMSLIEFKHSHYFHFTLRYF